MSLMDVGIRKPAIRAPDAVVADAAQLMTSRDVEEIVVVHGDRPVGIVTKRDLVRFLCRNARARATSIEQVMSSHLECVTADRSLAEAAEIMRQAGVRRLPVVGAHGELLGLIRSDDVERALGGQGRAAAPFPPTPRPP
jgi:CBS domain-containing protein